MAVPRTKTANIITSLDINDTEGIMEAVKKYFKSSQPSYQWEYRHGGHKNASACRESLWCYGREGSGASSKLCESRDSTGKGIFDAVGMETAHCVSYIADNAALKRVRERVWQRLWRHKIPIFMLFIVLVVSFTSHQEGHQVNLLSKQRSYHNISLSWYEIRGRQHCMTFKFSVMQAGGTILLLAFPGLL